MCDKMCEIEEVDREKYDKGETQLGKEIRCKACGYEDIVNAYKNEIPACPKCNSKETVLIGLHYPKKRPEE